MKVDFEGFLMDKHGESYIGTDDMMPDAFNEWIQDLDVDAFIEYGNEFAKSLLMKESNENPNQNPQGR